MKHVLFLAIALLAVTAVFAAPYGATLSQKFAYLTEHDRVLVCQAHGFTPTSYTWQFDDGQKLVHIKNANVYHHYTRLGQFQPTCTATDGKHNATASTTVLIVWAWM